MPEKSKKEFTQKTHKLLNIIKLAKADEYGAHSVTYSKKRFTKLKDLITHAEDKDDDETLHQVSLTSRLVVLFKIMLN